jgi:hypothetical protein
LIRSHGISVDSSNPAGHFLRHPGRCHNCARSESDARRTPELAWARPLPCCLANRNRDRVGDCRMRFAVVPGAVRNGALLLRRSPRYPADVGLFRCPVHAQAVWWHTLRSRRHSTPPAHAVRAAVAHRHEPGCRNRRGHYVARNRFALSLWVRETIGRDCTVNGVPNGNLLRGSCSLFHYPTIPNSAESLSECRHWTV